MSYLSTDEDEDAENLYRFDPKTLLRIDESEAQQLTETITTFYENHMQEAGLDGYVIGLSGGLDSTTVAHLLVEAVGSENVQGVILPAPHTQDEDIRAAVDTADRLDIETNNYQQFQDEVSDVVDTLESLGQEHEDTDVQRLKRGNILARCRMIVLRDTARAHDYMVAGTTNASERELGYNTLAADGLGGIDNEALYELYKTTERELAEYVGVQQDIIEKTPTADLWPAQTDHEELGFTYDVIDQVLAGFQIDMGDDVIADAVTPVSADNVKTIRDRVTQNEYKQELPPYPTL